MWYHNFEFSDKGRIWLDWDPNILRGKVLKITWQTIHAHFVSKLAEIKLIDVYSLHTIAYKKCLWSDLTIIESSVVFPWLITKDFNSIF